MQIRVDFPGNLRVDAHAGGFTIHTDQPPALGGEGSAPAPFTLFLASIAACVGIYVLQFCRQRGLPTEGVQVLQRALTRPGSELIHKIKLEIQVPADFPPKYHAALVRTAELCAVKKHFEHPPAFEIQTVVVENEA